MVEGSSPPARMGGSPAPRQQQVVERDAAPLSPLLQKSGGAGNKYRGLSLQGLLPLVSRALAGGLLPAT